MGELGTLTTAQCELLALVAELVVPASADGRKPSAADVDVLGYIRANEADTLPTLVAELDRLEAAAQGLHGAGFRELDRPSREALVAGLRTSDASFLRAFAVQTVTCYYQDARVLEAIGLEARPPFPKGNTVPAGDLSLLDPVRARGSLVRPA